MDTKGSGIVKDIKGNEFKIYPHRFATDMVLVSIASIGVPIGGLAIDSDNEEWKKEGEAKIAIKWNDNDFEYLEILNKIQSFLKGGSDKVKTIVDKSGDTIPIEIKQTPVVYLAITKKDNERAIVSAGINPVGEIIGYWVDKDFRNSPSLKQHIAILLLNTLYRDVEIKALKNLFTKVHCENEYAIKAQAEFGFTECRQIEMDGVKYYYSGQDIKQCRQKTRELTKVGV